MIGPIKGTPRRVSRFFAALLTLGPLTPSLAAPTPAPNATKPNPPTATNQFQAKNFSLESQPIQREAGNPSASNLSRSAAGQAARTSQFGPRSGKRVLMAFAPADQPGAEAEPDEAVREALARRRAWTGSRRPLSSSPPAKVQDPPAERKVAKAAPRPARKVRSQMQSQAVASSELLATAVAARPDNEDLIREALSNRGRPYVWGGSSRGGFDCSGFMLYLYKRMRGINLPHSAAAQSRLGKPVAREDLQPGDLVFFAGSRKAIGHVGMYIGENRIVHAANHVKNVRIDTLTGYYDRRYRGARRLTPTPFRIPANELQQLDPITGDGSEPPASEEQ